MWISVTAFTAASGHSNKCLASIIQTQKVSQAVVRTALLKQASSLTGTLPNLVWGILWAFHASFNWSHIMYTLVNMYWLLVWLFFRSWSQNCDLFQIYFAFSVRECWQSVQKWSLTSETESSPDVSANIIKNISANSLFLQSDWSTPYVLLLVFS